MVDLMRTAPDLRDGAVCFVRPAPTRAAGREPLRVVPVPILTAESSVPPLTPSGHVCPRMSSSRRVGILVASALPLFLLSIPVLQGPAGVTGGPPAIQPVPFT